MIASTLISWDLLYRNSSFDLVCVSSSITRSFLLVLPRMDVGVALAVMLSVACIGRGEVLDGFRPIVVVASMFGGTCLLVLPLTDFEVALVVLLSIACAGR